MCVEHNMSPVWSVGSFITGSFGQLNSAVCLSIEACEWCQPIYQSLNSHWPQLSQTFSFGRALYVMRLGHISLSGTFHSRRLTPSLFPLKQTNQFNCKMQTLLSIVKESWGEYVWFLAKIICPTSYNMSRLLTAATLVLRPKTTWYKCLTVSEILRLEMTY